METMNVTFDELLAMDFEQSNSKPGLQSMTSGQISSGLVLTYAPSTITAQQPTERELDLLFETMYDDYIGGQPSAATRSELIIPDLKANRQALEEGGLSILSEGELSISSEGKLSISSEVELRISSEGELSISSEGELCI
ncbi:hypothetical protein Tco_0683602 [Tanacetum coccineum]